MAQLIPNTFSSFSLTPEEEESGSVLNGYQKMVLQNKLSQIATQKINEVYDPLKPLIFVQQIGYLQGQLDIISWLLDSSNTIEEEIAKRVAANSTDQ